MACDQLTQQFRTKWSPDTIRIPAQLDEETGQQIILWRDVQQYFSNAKGALDNGRAVLFLTDNKFKRLEPWRIPYRPDTVLEVTAGDPVGDGRHSPAPSIEYSSQQPTASISVSAFSNGHASPDKRYRAQDSSDDRTPPFSEITASGISIASRRMMNSSTNNTVLTRTMSFGERASFRRHTSSNVKAIVQRAMSENFSQTPENFQCAVLLERLLRNQERGNQQQQQIMDLQKQTIDLQYHTLDRMAIIQSGIRTLITQTYELHEYPIPRLFIVLPEVTRRPQEMTRKLLPHQFRVYFLCECGEHTKSENTTTPHEVHLANHEGYDLDKPAEFFEKYGTYVLTLMYMFKVGTTAAGVVVPPCTGLKIDGELKAAPKLMEYMKDIGSLVDDSIMFLEDLKDNKNYGTEVEEAMRLNDRKILEGADLRQLKSYLKVKNEHVLGNMYRIVTLKGHVKWVCLEHYRETQEESASSMLKQYFKLGHGYINENLGEIQVVLGYSVAKEFYNALLTVPRIQKLIVCLEWEASTDDLRKLSTAVTKAGIVDLTIDGKSLLGRTLDLWHRYDRFDPIMQLAANGKLQALSLVMFKNLFRRLSSKAFIKAPQLRVLKIDSPFDTEPITWHSSLDQILTSCFNVVDFGLRVQKQELIVPVMMEILSKLKKSRCLELHYGQYTTTATISCGQIQTIQLFLPYIVDFAHDDQTYSTYSQCFLDEDITLKQAVTILRENQKLSEIRIGYQTARPNDMIQTIAATRHDLNTGTALRTVELICLQNDKNVRPVGVTMDFTGSEGVHDFCIDVSMVPQGGLLNSYYDILFDYGWSIKALDARDGAIDDELARLLDKSTEKKNSKLKSLTLDTKRLSQTGLKGMDRVISRSKRLERLVLDCQSLNIDTEREKANALLSQHGKQLTELSLHGDNCRHVKRWLAEAFPTREAFPKLTHLQLTLPYDSEPQDPHLYISWLSKMVSSPPSTSTSSSAQDNISTPEAWSPLKRLGLHYKNFALEDWKKIIEAIDFSQLETLDLTSTNFAMEQFDLLIECLSKLHGKAPLRVLNLLLSCLSEGQHELLTKLDAFKENAPHAKIIGLEKLEQN
ncbi:hypothetical protein BGZ65_011078 [Modicella reniformis]|uniref:Uncharacterized protein n=1 Tax=Modicella reniformis TaxID=1440133 RepID=A0A9P6IPD6_9FUNG|nr:hypothetical protein BGZ65_011078 [Modicella reniformis]